MRKFIAKQYNKHKMPKITKVFGMIIVVVLLLSIPIFIREEIEHYKKKKHMLENFGSSPFFVGRSNLG